MKLELNNPISDKELADFLELSKLTKELGIIEDGKDGKPGKDGKNGLSGKNGKDGKDGKDGLDGKDGKDGLNGKDGKPGLPGKDGIGKDGKDGIFKYKWNGQNLGIWNKKLGKYEYINLSGARGFPGERGQPGIPGSTPTFEEGISFEDIIYLYVVFGVDGNWIVDRYLRTNLLQTSTGNQTGTKPTTLAELQALTYT